MKKHLLCALCVLLLIALPLLTLAEPDSLSRDLFSDIQGIEKIELVTRSGKTRELNSDLLWDGAALLSVRPGDLLRRIVYRPSSVAAIWDDEDSVLNLREIVVTETGGVRRHIACGGALESIGRSLTRARGLWNSLWEK